ncbi:hypothetical protein Tco_1459929 [Tanacetum coccineum]
MAEYQNEFEMIISRVTGKFESLLTMIYIFGLKVALLIELLGARPTTLGEAFSLARLFEARVEATTHKEKATTEKEDTINETTYTLTSLQSRVASLEAKGSLDASEDPNFRIQEKAVKHVRALNVAPLEMVFAGVLMRFVVNFEGVGNVTPWAADIERRKIVKCYVQGSGKGKKGYWSWQRKVVRDELR